MGSAPIVISPIMAFFFWNSYFDNNMVFEQWQIGLKHWSPEQGHELMCPMYMSFYFLKTVYKSRIEFVCYVYGMQTMTFYNVKVSNEIMRIEISLNQSPVTCNSAGIRPCISYQAMSQLILIGSNSEIRGCVSMPILKIESLMNVNFSDSLRLLFVLFFLW